MIVSDITTENLFTFDSAVHSNAEMHGICSTFKYIAITSFFLLHVRASPENHWRSGFKPYWDTCELLCVDTAVSSKCACYALACCLTTTKLMFAVNRAALQHDAWRDAGLPTCLQACSSTSGLRWQLAAGDGWRIGDRAGPDLTAPATVDSPWMADPRRRAPRNTMVPTSDGLRDR